MKQSNCVLKTEGFNVSSEKILTISKRNNISIEDTICAVLSLSFYKICLDDESIAVNNRKIHFLLSESDTFAQWIYNFLDCMKEEEREDLFFEYGIYKENSNVRSQNDYIAEYGISENEIVVTYHKFSELAKGSVHSVVENVINAIYENNAVKVSDIELIDNLEAVKKEFQANNRVYTATFLEGFYRVALEHPYKIAVCDEYNALTYDEYNRKSNRIANALLDLGIKKGDIIGYFMPTTVEGLIVIMGIIKMGAAYLPLLNSMPADRISYMLNDSNAKYIVADCDKELIHKKELLLYYDNLILNENEKNPNISINDDDIYACLYTSGSTGKPKGVLAVHGGLTEVLYKLITGVTEYGNTLLCTPMSFIMSVFEIVMSLAFGDYIYVCNPDVMKNPSEFRQVLHKKNINVLITTPSYFDVLTRDEKETRILLEHLNLIFLGGEKVYVNETVDKVTEGTKPAIYDGYGSTEIHTAIYREIKDEYGEIPEFARILIVNKEGHILPPGLRGEIYVGSTCVAQGYVNNQEETKNRFLYGYMGRKRTYKTGDIGVADGAGNVRVLGRGDFQVKIRGYRIEIKEVEHVINEIEEISGGVVVTRINNNNEKYLCAFYEGNIEQGEVERYLSTKLPEYMIPAYLIKLEQIPRLISGKYNIKLLSEMNIDDYVSNYIEPETDLQKRLCTIWEGIIGADRIGIRDSFFKIGGDSIKLAKTIAKIKKDISIEISYTDFFENPTVEKLAGFIEKQAGNISQWDKAPIRESYHMTTSQIGIFLDYKKGLSTNYNLSYHVKFDKSFSPKKYIFCVNEIIKKHEALRTTFHYENNKFIQKICNRYTLNCYVKKVEEYSDRYFCDFVKPFNLEALPLIRTEIIEDNTGFHVLIDIHHIAADGYSINLFFNELGKLYHGESLSPCEYQYRDYCENEYRLMKERKDQKYWIELFNQTEQTKCNFIPDFCGISNGGAVSYIYKSTLSENICKNVTHYCIKHGITGHMFYLGCLSIVLRYFCNQSEFAVGTPMIGRNDIEAMEIFGMLVKTLPIILRVEDADTLNDYFGAVKASCIAAFDHSNCQLERLRQETQHGKSADNSALFNVMLAYQNNERSQWDDDSIMEIETPDTREPKYDLLIEMEEISGKLYVNWEYLSSIFSRDTVISLMQHFEIVIKAALRDDRTRIKDIKLSSNSDMEIVRAFNHTSDTMQYDRSIIDMFKKAVYENADYCALEFRKERFTYRELDRESDKVARYLMECEVGKGDIIPFIISRGSNCIIAMLGILKAGCAYMPIDAEYPQNRIHFMIEDSKASLVIADEENEGLVSGCKVCRIEKMRERDIEKPLDYDIDAEDLCYCIYTSGSTGKPKGTLLKHKTICNLVAWELEKTDISISKRVLAGTTIGFDVAAQEIFSALLTGGTLVVLPDGYKTDMKKYCEYICEHSIDVIFCTPSYFNLYAHSLELAGRICAVVSDIVMAGEPFYVQEALRKVLNKENVRMHNHYGPTETHVVTAKTYDHDYDAAGNSIGTPISNTELVILNESGNILPPCFVGELCIAGDGVGAGYLNRENLTNEKFTRMDGTDRRMYHTGDLARWSHNGEIQFLGRMDEQVKVRGLRIELGEIRMSIKKYPQIIDAVVTLQKDTDSDYLCAYIVSETDIDYNDLKKQLRSELAEYMVPEHYMRIDSIPLSHNGKVLRSALPKVTHSVEYEYVKPSTNTEKLICELYEMVLGKEKVGITDNFFKIGGHSLKAMQLVNEINNRIGKVLEIKELFNNPTVHDLAAYIDQSAEKNIQNIKKAEPSKEYPVSSVQKRIYLSHNMAKNTCTYNIPTFLKVSGNLNINKMQDAINGVVAANSILRTTFEIRNGDIVQIIHKDVFIELELNKELSHFVRPFDLEKGPLLRACYNEKESVMVLDMHHIVADAITVANFLEQLHFAYVNQSDIKPELQYCDYAEWMRDGNLQKVEESKQYWIDKFRDDVPVLNMVTDYVRPAKKSYKGRTIQIEVGSGISTMIREYASKHNITSYMLFIGTLFLVLSKYSRQEDIVIGTPVSGRTVKETEEMLGLFVNTLPLRMRVEPDTLLSHYFNAVKDECLNAYDNQDCPIEDVVEALNMERDSSRNPLFDVVFNMYANETIRVDMGDVVLSELDYSDAYNISKFDININVKENKEHFEILCEYSEDIFSEATIRKFIEVYCNALSEVSRYYDRCIREINYCNDIQTNQILNLYNENQWRELPYTSIGEAFEAVVRLNKDKYAVQFDNVSLTYEQLYERAAKYALYLKECGMTAGDRISMCIERCEKVIIVQLAVIMSGCVFVPIDNDYPDERINYIITNAGAKAAIVEDESIAAASGVQAISIAELDDKADSINALGFESETDCLETECYDIYTSGSTGRPKGCRLTHKGILNFAVNNNILETIDTIRQPTGVAVNSVAFDYFIAETLLLLLNGCKVVLASRLQQTDQEELRKLVIEKRVNFIQTTPTRLGLYMENREHTDFFRQFEMVVLSGEELKKSFFRELKEITDAKIYNPCGPSEASVWAAGGNISDCEADNDCEIHIGKAICNTRLYVLDEMHKLLPAGMPGELAIGGMGVGLGYINNPLTEEKFIDNPFAEGKMYLTGDLAAWNNDGNIRYLGRIDQQVKIKGIRIEIGEIEAVIKAQEGVSQAVVLVKEEDGIKQLWAYIVADKKVDLKEIRKNMSSVLPKYMLPARMMQIDRIIYNSNGKVDKKNFPDIPLEIENYNYVSLSEQEQRLADMIANILGVDKIYAENDFFELGGDSIKAIRMVTKLREAGYEISVKQIMAAQTIGEILESASESQAMQCDQNEFVGSIKDTPILCEFSEWNLKSPDYFNQCSFIKIQNREYKREYLMDVLNVICRQHDMLRARYIDSQLYVDAYQPDKHFKLFEYDIEQIEAEDAFVYDKCTFINESMDIVNGPLVRIGIFRAHSYTHIMFAIHHLVIDGVSWRIFMDDFNSLYRQRMEGSEIKAGYKTISYNAWADMLAEYANLDYVRDEIPYWRDITDHIKLTNKGKGKACDRKTNIDTRTKTMDRACTDLLLYGIHDAYNTEINDLLVSALVKSVYELTDEKEVSIELEGHGREELHKQVLTDRTIGWFTTLYPMNFNADSDLKELIIGVKENLRRVPDKGIGYGILKHYCKCFDNVKPAICFNYLGDFDTGYGSDMVFEASEFECGKMIASDNVLSNDISVNCRIKEKKLLIEISFDEAIFSSDFIEALAEKYAYNLHCIATHCMSVDSTVYSASDFGAEDMDSEDLDEILNLFN